MFSSILTNFKILIFALLLGMLALPLSAQQEISEKQAKQAVYEVVRFSGLLPNFVVRENKDVKTAIAYIKGKERYIEYNPEIMARIVDSTKTDWSAISILAHEIAHHLLGHTLDPGKISPGDELACDKYSGFILANMGATLDEAIAAIKVAGSAKATKTHPPRSSRIEAITQGWQEAIQFKNGETINASMSAEENYTFKLRFEGDDNLYYINDRLEVVWYDNYASPIVFGKFLNADSRSYVYEITWDDNRFYVDSQLKVWNLTTYNVMMPVGELLQLQP